MGFNNILVYRIGHLGDTLVSLPAFWSVRRNFPDAELTLLTNANARNRNFVPARNVLPASGLFDAWMTYPSEVARTRSVVALARLFFQIKRKKFDTLVYLTTRNRTVRQISRDIKFFRAAGIKNIIGTGHLLENLIDPQAVRPLPAVDSEREFLLKCLANDGLSVDFGEKAEMNLTRDERDYAGDWLRKHCGEAFGTKRLVGVAPGSKWSSKIWAEDRFEAVMARLIREFDVFPIVFGGEEDRPAGERLLDKWRVGANAAGELNIRQAAAALARCSFYLGNDTGTMHLAAAVGTPCVAVFAAIDYAGRWFPGGQRHRIFRRQVECEACYAPVCFNDRKCLEEIGVEEVYRGCREVLENEKEI